MCKPKKITNITGLPSYIKFLKYILAAPNLTPSVATKFSIKFKQLSNYSHLAEITFFTTTAVACAQFL